MKNGEAFNLEKESKIINPHQMDMKTTSGNTFKNFKVGPRTKELKKVFPDKDFMCFLSSISEFK